MHRGGKFQRKERAFVSKRAFPLSVKYGAAMEFSGDFLLELAIDPENMEQELIDHPGKLAYFSQLAILAKLHFRKTYAEVYGTIRSKMERNEEKITEKLLEQLVNDDGDVQRADQDAKLLEAAVDALRARGSALGSIVSIMGKTDSTIRVPSCVEQRTAVKEDVKEKIEEKRTARKRS